MAHCSRGKYEEWRSGDSSPPNRGDNRREGMDPDGGRLDNYTDFASKRAGTISSAVWKTHKGSNTNIDPSHKTLNTNISLIMYQVMK